MASGSSIIDGFEVQVVDEEGNVVTTISRRNSMSRGSGSLIGAISTKSNVKNVPLDSSEIMSQVAPLIRRDSFRAILSQKESLRSAAESFYEYSSDEEEDKYSESDSLSSVSTPSRRGILLVSLGEGVCSQLQKLHWEKKPIFMILDRKA
eukprot:TRINITY_DN6313_c0_g1_i1.p1 TRINITY_DN6313_c0_g1~~TRINITY_DN6313_c0_g1_i1.p1  ORF type:complete len:150 (-),score=20.97 TRINITY_DN6313_c0_g1_i1:384-833(-)